MTAEASSAWTDAIRLRDAAEYGLTRASLRTAAWSVVSRGLYQRTALVGSELQCLVDMQQVLPLAAAWSHYTGAGLSRFWLPSLPADLGLFATLPPGATRPERDGLYVARSRACSCEPHRVGPVGVLPAPLLLGQLAEDLALIDLVVAVDSALHQGWCTVEQVTAAILPRQRGAAHLRAALALADGRSESAYETVLRLFHVLCGFSVTPQFKVHDAHGAVVARADLRIDGTYRLPEYDGAHHRDRDRHRSDLRREKTLSRLGMDRYGYTAAEILSSPTVLLRDAEQASGLMHDPRRLRRWLVEVRRSSLLTSGRARLDHRLLRYSNCRTRTA